MPSALHDQRRDKGFVPRHRVFYAGFYLMQIHYISPETYMIQYPKHEEGRRNGQRYLSYRSEVVLKKSRFKAG